MRTFFALLLLALPGLALAGDCPQGWNGPLNANTNPTTQAPGQVDSIGTLVYVPKTAYPH